EGGGQVVGEPDVRHLAAAPVDLALGAGAVHGPAQPGPGSRAPAGLVGGPAGDRPADPGSAGAPGHGVHDPDQGQPVAGPVPVDERLRPGRVADPAGGRPGGVGGGREPAGRPWRAWPAAGSASWAASWSAGPPAPPAHPPVVPATRARTTAAPATPSR